MNLYPSALPINGEVIKKVCISIQKHIGLQLPLRAALSSSYQFVSGSPQFSRENHQSDGATRQHEGEDCESNRTISDPSFILRFLPFCFFIVVSFYLQGCGWSYFYDDRQILGATIISGGIVFGLGGLGWFLFG